MASHSQTAPASPQPEPVYNLARSAIGTNLFYLDQQGDPIGLVPEYILTPAVLVGDDEVLSYDLRPGRSLMVIELPAAASARHLTFFNFGARGSATPSWAASRAEADAGQWTRGAPVPFSQIGPITSQLPAGTTLQFLRVELNIEQPGRISGMGIAGLYPNAEPPSPSNLVRTRKTDLPLSNVVSFGSSSSVIGSSATAQNQLEPMIDDLVDTYVDFKPASSPRVALIDLGEAREIRHVSVLSDAPPGEIKVFFISDPDSVSDALGQPAQGSASPPLILTNVDLPRLEREVPFITLTIRPGQKGVTQPIQPRTSRFVLFVLPPGPEPIRVWELNLLGRYEWLWKPDALAAPAEGFRVQPATFSPPPAPGSPPPLLDQTPLSP